MLVCTDLSKALSRFRDFSKKNDVRYFVCRHSRLKISRTKQAFEFVLSQVDVKF